MQKYHNIECPVWARVKHQANEKFLRQLTIRTVITAIREAGSIEKLREEIKEIDECTGKRRHSLYIYKRNLCLITKFPCSSNFNNDCLN